ncbi:MAG: hypothetical protein PHQ75_05845 [Thermoguttaceae bacterium]|nr:hypothetical protein [Thermoguttaceae bacterium]
MIHLSNNREEVMAELSRINCDTLTRDDVLQIILKLEYVSIPFGPQYIEEHFQDFYRTGIKLFGTWNDLLNFTGMRKRPPRYYGKEYRELAISSEQEYRSVFMSQLNQIKKARLQLPQKRHDTLLLPCFRKDEPIIMTSGKKTREWIQQIHRLFPALFYTNDRFPLWHKEELPKLTTGPAYVQKNGEVVRLVWFGEKTVKVILWIPREKKSNENE